MNFYYIATSKRVALTLANRVRWGGAFESGSLYYEVTSTVTVATAFVPYTTVNV